MKSCFTFCLVFAAACLNEEEDPLHSHDDLQFFSMYRNPYRGLATKTAETKKFEVWRTSLSVDSKSPHHVHETKEIFIALKDHILGIDSKICTLKGKQLTLPWR